MKKGKVTMKIKPVRIYKALRTLLAQDRSHCLIVDVQMLIINELAGETYSSHAIDCTTFPANLSVLTEGIFQLSTTFSHVLTQPQGLHQEPVGPHPQPCGWTHQRPHSHLKTQRGKKPSHPRTFSVGMEACSISKNDELCHIESSH